MTGTAAPGLTPPSWDAAEELRERPGTRSCDRRECVCCGGAVGASVEVVVATGGETGLLPAGVAAPEDAPESLANMPNGFGIGAYR
jgi:hypothetical protein